MSDLIERQTAIDALDEPCDVSDTWTDEYAVGERSQWEKDVKALNSLPSVQPEIIRCKDCKHLFEDNKCPLRTWWTHTEEDFCSYAERKTDG